VVSALFLAIESRAESAHIESDAAVALFGERVEAFYFICLVFFFVGA